MGRRHADWLGGEAGGEFVLADCGHNTATVAQGIEMKAVPAQALHANLAVNVVCALPFLD